MFTGPLAIACLLHPLRELHNDGRQRWQSAATDDHNETPRKRENIV
jgi:hypothetical protein